MSHWVTIIVISIWHPFENPPQINKPPIIPFHRRAAEFAEESKNNHEHPFFKE